MTHFLVRQAAGSYFKAETATGGSEIVVSPIDERVGDCTENLLLWLTSPRSLIITEVRNKIPHLVGFEICQNGSKSPVGFSVSEANGGAGLTQYLRYGHRAIPHSHHRHLSHAPAYLSPWAADVGVSNAPHLSHVGEYGTGALTNFGSLSTSSRVHSGSRGTTQPLHRKDRWIYIHRSYR